tara:strand:- start:283 stop:987 length:705 start_codon:yes stop_codon:yes gene_type:complete
MFKTFKPGIPLTISMLVALVILLSLGTWQARKIGPKTDLLNRIEVGLQAEPMPLPVHLDDPKSVEYRRVFFDGKRLAEPIKVFGINQSGGSGYFLYAPVQKDHGMAVLVNFGWIPHATRELPELPTRVSNFTGVLMSSATPGTMTLPNDSAGGSWFLADVHEMAAHFGLRTKEYYHFRVFADQVGKGGELPLGGQIRVDIPNDHLEYAFTWYGLAASLLGIFIAFGIKRGRKAA